jgi:hypothetical protein
MVLPSLLRSLHIANYEESFFFKFVPQIDENARCAILFILQSHTTLLECVTCWCEKISRKVVVLDGVPHLIKGIFCIGGYTT